MEQTLTNQMSGMERSEDQITPDQFDDLVRQHQTRVYRVLWCELRDEDAAATLTQECFLRAYQSRKQFRGEASVSTWLIRIAVNLARDHQRSRRQGFWRNLFRRDQAETHEGAALVASQTASPERALIARQQVEQVMKIVDSLAEKQRTAFLLRFVEELSLEDIAGIMGVEQGTVKSHLSRAVGTLRRMKEGSAE